MAHLLLFKTSNIVYIAVILHFRKKCTVVKLLKAASEYVGFHVRTAGGVRAATFCACGKASVPSCSKCAGEAMRRKACRVTAAQGGQKHELQPLVPSAGTGRQGPGTETGEQQVSPFFCTLSSPKATGTALSQGGA